MTSPDPAASRPRRGRGRGAGEPALRTVVLDPDGEHHTLLLCGHDGFRKRIRVVGDPPARFAAHDRKWVCTGKTSKADRDSAGVLLYREIDDIT